MAIVPTIISPGVEIREYDVSVRPTVPAGTSVFIPGFSSQGPTGEVTYISDLDEFESMFGYPTTEAERYAYATISEVLKSNATVMFSRLPYGAGPGDTTSPQYTVLAYPALGYTVDYGDTVGTTKRYGYQTTITDESGSSVTVIAKKTEKTTKEPTAVLFVKEGEKYVTYGTTEGFVSETLNVKALVEDLQVVTDGGSLVNTGSIVLKSLSGQTDFNYISKLIELGFITSVSKLDKVIYTISDYGADATVTETEWTQFIQKSIETDTTTGSNKVVESKYMGEGTVVSGDLYSADVPDSPTYAVTEAEKFSDGSKGFLVDNEVKGDNCITYLVGEPVQFNISLDDYYRFINGLALGTDDLAKEFVWSDDITKTDIKNLSVKDLGKFAFLAFNINKSVTNERYEGYYLGLCDNAFTDPGSAYESVTALKTVTSLPEQETAGLSGDNYTNVPEGRLDFQLASDTKGSLSQILEESITSFSTSDKMFNDTLNVGIFKIRESSTSGDASKLSAVFNGGYNASIGFERKTTTKNSTISVDFFIENVSKNSDNIINFFVNPFVSGAKRDENNRKRGLNIDGTPKVKLRMLTKQLARKHKISAIELNEDSGGAPSQEELNQMTVEQVIAEPTGIIRRVYDEIVDNDNTIGLADAIYPLGLYSESNNATKLIGNVPEKVATALNLVSNEELYSVDIIPNGGLGSIYVGAMDNARNAFNKAVAEEILLGKTEEEAIKTVSDLAKQKLGIVNDMTMDYLPDQTYYDPTKFIVGVNDLRTSKTTIPETAMTVVSDHRAVDEAFLTLCCSQQDGGRGDCFYVGDSIRQISIEGKDSKIQTRFSKPLVSNNYTAANKVTHSFSMSIYWALRHLFDRTASSYMAVYPQFIKHTDPLTSSTYWGPSSGSVIRKMAATDEAYGPWQAAAGLNNGVLGDVIDISYDTNQRQRDDLYKISLNTIVNRPDSGITVWGVRTMIKKSSSFDQITCRRTFLYIEKLLRDTSKQFLFEGNTYYTRLRIQTILTPIFDTIQNNRGIYNYVFICDERNNTPDVIDEGFINMDFYAAATRTAERILIGVHATRYDTTVTESENL